MEQSNQREPQTRRKNSMGNGIPKNQQKELTEVTNYTSILILEKWWV